MSWRVPRNIYEARDYARHQGRQRSKYLKRFKTRWEPAFRVGCTVRLRFERWRTHAIGPFGVVIAVEQKDKWSQPHYLVHIWLERIPGYLDFTQPGYDELELEAWEPKELGGRNYGHSTKWEFRNASDPTD